MGGGEQPHNTASKGSLVLSYESCSCMTGLQLVVPPAV